jgi:hypothetical protein
LVAIYASKFRRPKTLYPVPHSAVSIIQEGSIMTINISQFSKHYTRVQVIEEMAKWLKADIPFDEQAYYVCNNTASRFGLKWQSDNMGNILFIER